MLAGSRLGDLLDKLSPEYDFIMIDTPPTLIVADSLIIKNHTNGYIVVVRSDVSSTDLVGETVSKLHQIDAKVCGFVLNGQKVKSGRHYGKYGKYGKYSKYSKYSKYGI